MHKHGFLILSQEEKSLEDTKAIIKSHNRNKRAGGKKTPVQKRPVRPKFIILPILRA